MPTVTINGNTITVPGGCSVSVVNGEVFVNGARYAPDLASRELRVIVEGSVHELRVDRGSVEVRGDVTGMVECGGSATVGGVVNDVDAGGSVNCRTVGMNVKAGGSVNCGNVGGKVSAGGSVRHG